MDIKTYGGAARLLVQILDRSSRTLPRIATAPQKPPCPEGGAAAPLPRETAAAHGIAQEYVNSFFDELERDKTVNPHGVMVIADGCVIGEKYWGAYSSDYPQTTYSECKSITSLAVGMCIDDGILTPDDRIIDIFRDNAPLFAQLTHKSITVRDLLTMSSGVSFGEAGSVTETDWVRGFLDSVLLFEPGSSFFYNSMNSYMLSAIVTRLTGLSMSDFLKTRLFEPLGITDAFWESCPKGNTKGGWGLYIRPDDIAKIALLVMGGGEWKGRRLVSKSWIDAATSVQFVTPESFTRYSYGYQIWVGKSNGAFLFNGMFGQNVFCYPKRGIIVVANAGSSDFFQQSGIFGICDKYFAGLERTQPLPDMPAAPEQRTNVLRRLFSRRAKQPEQPPKPELPELAHRLSGREFFADSSSSASVGLFPLVLQAVQNNYTSGLRSVAFEKTDGVFWIIFNENDETHRLAAGFDAPAYSDLIFHEEPYRVGTRARAAVNEDGVDVLVVDVDFVETASTRHIKLFVDTEQTVTLKMSETPGKQFMMHAFASAAAVVRKFPAFGGIAGKKDSDFFAYKIDRAAEPELTLTAVR